MPPSSPLRGFTLPEALLALALAALLVTASIPSLLDVIDRRRVEGAAAQLASDLQFARIEAVSRNQAVRVGVFAESGTCYLLHTGASDACRCSGDGTVSCEAGAQVLRAAPFLTGGPLRVQANVASLLFDPLHGTSTPAGMLQVLGRRGHGVQHVVNVMGRVRSCSPQSPMPGLRAC